ncbi:Cyanovirin-N [Pleomassaria siparia CBS 279.74]|uniref:Cyanovirin-N n=1 Tax=Pleomassaria siparia CBS 279.74 TaxID=1314801 RepID=A0A6G1JT64_9PLEO|nr:Cyanovirin-N [Pleomassaria siparia CBS 279.74]
MSFHLSAEDIRVDDNHILRARLQSVDGEWRDAEIDLDNHLGNTEGMIQWDGGNFSQSVENVEFSIEGGGEVPVLRCFCRDSEGNEYARDVNLSERISNQDGQFVYN